MAVHTLHALQSSVAEPLSSRRPRSLGFEPLVVFHDCLRYIGSDPDDFTCQRDNRVFEVAPAVDFCILKCQSISQHVSKTIHAQILPAGRSWRPSASPSSPAPPSPCIRTRATPQAPRCLSSSLSTERNNHSMSGAMKTPHCAWQCVMQWLSVPLFLRGCTWISDGLGYFRLFLFHLDVFFTMKHLIICQVVQKLLTFRCFRHKTGTERKFRMSLLSSFESRCAEEMCSVNS